MTNDALWVGLLIIEMTKKIKNRKIKFLEKVINESVI